MARTWMALMLLFNCLSSSEAGEIEDIHSQCPMSSTFPFTDGYHGYPMDIYAEADETRMKKISSTGSYHTWTCQSYVRPIDKVMTDHTCSDEKICPLHQQNVDKAMERQKQWMTDQPSSVLCNMQQAIEQQQPVNVVVLGGSVTAGVTTQGCCKDETLCGGIFYPVNKNCNWVQYMQRWLDTLGTGSASSKVKIYNAAHPGYNADTFKENLIDKLHETIRQGFKFTKSDVVLIDLSVNDANTFGGKNKITILERGLEALIRRIHTSMSEPGSLPTIVILEMWPFAHLGGAYKYTNVYEKIARHYNISIWSYQDALLDTTYVEAHQSSILSYLNFKNNLAASHGHPPWHVHMFYADMMSRIMQQELNACSSSDSSTGADKQQQSFPYPVIRSADMLPEPLHKQKFYQCKNDTVPSISFSAHREYNVGTGGDRNNSISSQIFQSEPVNQWQLREDKITRPGLIHEYTNPQYRDEVVARFTLNKQPSEFHGGQLLQIMYLRSYNNMGKVRVQRCGQDLRDGRLEVARLDGLWPDFETFHFSLPEIYTLEVSSESCPAESKITIELVHEYIPEAHMKTSAEQNARNNQKFKLLELKVCELQESA